ncbi:hypothetical protein CXG81DRAFT_25021 [Caulochytrium protostelioides]|uniref:Uncharacterized protein n=1 Tax=Caulochytrium protostelioides TaxID=1555241 RepID=A0A4P9XAE9_9FUNG|nr:hypothetical protein CXG81DRAFT_25021 [Caulochytrium protostelioides]|eukprot:RKP02328.1 hypothetical protein CXG81DRAFT_25021 [Caulochytrium protostelioides]
MSDARPAAPAASRSDDPAPLSPAKPMASVFPYRLDVALGLMMRSALDTPMDLLSSGSASTLLQPESSVPYGYPPFATLGSPCGGPADDDEDACKPSRGMLPALLPTPIPYHAASLYPAADYDPAAASPPAGGGSPLAAQAMGLPSHPDLAQWLRDMVLESIRETNAPFAAMPALSPDAVALPPAHPLAADAPDAAWAGRVSATAPPRMMGPAALAAVIAGSPAKPAAAVASPADALAVPWAHWLAPPLGAGAMDPFMPGMPSAAAMPFADAHAATTRATAPLLGGFPLGYGLAAAAAPPPSLGPLNPPAAGADRGLGLHLGHPLAGETYDPTRVHGSSPSAPHSTTTSSSSSGGPTAMAMDIESLLSSPSSPSSLNSHGTYGYASPHRTSASAAATAATAAAAAAAAAFTASGLALPTAVGSSRRSLTCPSAERRRSSGTLTYPLAGSRPPAARSSTHALAAAPLAGASLSLHSSLDEISEDPAAATPMTSRFSRSTPYLTPAHGPTKSPMALSTQRPLPRLEDGSDGDSASTATLEARGMPWTWPPHGAPASQPRAAYGSSMASVEALRRASHGSLATRDVVARGLALQPSDAGTYHGRSTRRASQVDLTSTQRRRFHNYECKLRSFLNRRPDRMSADKLARIDAIRDELAAHQIDILDRDLISRHKKLFTGRFGNDWWEAVYHLGGQPPQIDADTYAQMLIRLELIASELPESRSADALFIIYDLLREFGIEPYYHIQGKMTTTRMKYQRRTSLSAL